MTHGEHWQDQWARIERWRERVRQSRDGPRPDALGTEAYRDEVFALFQAIWHLKDWLRHDEQAPSVQDKTADAWVFAQPHYLQAAYDIANASKHMVPDHPAVDAAQIRNSANVHIGVGHQHTFYVELARTGEEFEAVVLADLCLAEWREFLAGHNLEPPESE